jgi:hypothetical protein
MYNELVTPATSCETSSKGVSERTRGVAGAGAELRPKSRLEDVEKIVSRHDIEIEDLVDSICEIMFKLQAMGVSFLDIE